VEEEVSEEALALVRVGVDVFYDGGRKEITMIDPFTGVIELTWTENGEEMVTHTSEYRVARRVYRELERERKLKERNGKGSK